MLKVIISCIITYFFSQSISVGRVSFLLRKKGLIFYNFLCVYLVLCLIRIFINDYKMVIFIVSLLFYLISLVMYYIHEFRGTNINFSDILSINTAKEVAGGYTYNVKFIFVVVFIYLLCILYSIIRDFTIPVFTFNFIDLKLFESIIYRRIISKVSYIVLFIVSFMLLREKISSSKYDYSLCAGENEGYIYNFFSSMPIFHRKDVINKGEMSYIDDSVTNEVLNVSSYNIINQDTERSQSETSIESDRLPHIIVVMNESFGSVHERVKTNIEVTPYFNSLPNVTKGSLYVNTFGGGTANTEFEFLTGMTIGNYEYPVMPYNNFVKSDKYSLARYFSKLGYATKALHPYTSTNYHRDTVYKKFGFDELVFYDDFNNKECVRNYVSDEAFYKEVIERFNQSKELNEKLFLFGITMQNHSGYQKFDGAKIKSELETTESLESIDSYLSLMKISDEALKTLIDYFEKENEHVIILFFGDHNASFGTEINKLVFDTNIDYECTNAYKTPFFIFDNKYREDRYIEEVSANFLSIELLDKAGLPYDEFHKLLKEVYDKYPVYNYHKMKSREDGLIFDIEYNKYMMLERKYLL